MDGERGMYEWAEKWRGKVKEKEKEHNGQPSASDLTEASLKATSPHYPCAQNEEKSRRNERFESKELNEAGWDGMGWDSSVAVEIKSRKDDETWNGGRYASVLSLSSRRELTILVAALGVVEGVV